MSCSASGSDVAAASLSRSASTCAACLTAKSTFVHNGAEAKPAPSTSLEAAEELRWGELDAASSSSRRSPRIEAKFWRLVRQLPRSSSSSAERDRLAMSAHSRVR